MNEIRTMISSMVMSDFKNDEAIICISDIYSDDAETALKAYSRLCEILLERNLTLSGYISLLTVRDEDKVFSEYIRTHSELLGYNISRDTDILSEIAKIQAGELVDYLRERFGIPERISFPRYVNGSTEISFEKAAAYRERFGTSFFADNKAFIYENGRLGAVTHFDDIRLSALKSYEPQRNAVIDNTERFLYGKPYNNALLYGDRGTGKSCTVKAVVNEFPELRIVLVPRSSVTCLYDIYDRLRGIPLKFILFLDDMSFSDGDPEYGFLKQALEGSVCVMPDNCVIYATTNRRHIIRENADDRDEADAREENASLADRFGLYLTFMQPDKKTYIEIIEKLAADRGIRTDRDELVMLAERFAVRKGNRSPRTARQFVDTLDGKN